MFDDPLDMVYSLVERSYLRLQAAELLATCLESGEIAPLEELVEGLVLVGPQSLGALREILSEVDERKVQIQHDIDQVLQELAAKLKEYGATFESQEGLAQLALHLRARRDWRNLHILTPRLCYSCWTKKGSPQKPIKGHVYNYSRMRLKSPGVWKFTNS